MFRRAASFLYCAVKGSEGVGAPPPSGGGGEGVSQKTDAEILDMMKRKEMSFYGLEAALKPDYSRAVSIRRAFVKDYIYRNNDRAKVDYMNNIPYKGYDWEDVVGSNCENVIGYVPVPIGFAGPLLMDNTEIPIPMATTEGALVASTHRGARAVSSSGGCTTRVVDDGMTRSPVIGMPDLGSAVALKQWCEDNFDVLKQEFSKTTRYGKLVDLKMVLVGRKAYMRFKSFTADAMGMNMVTKGVEKILEHLATVFPQMQVISVSGNYCTDKKPSAINWVVGRGKSVCAEAVISKENVEKTLKTTVDSLISLNIDKNFVGSAMAGSVGGFNAHAANIVAAIFLATGQDPAQVVESCTCLTYMEKVNDNLVISVTMPSIEVGTVGGGTSLKPQRAVLDMIGCGGANKEDPGKNAQTLARIVGASVLCGELSILSAQAAGHLVSSHMRLNRK